MNSKPKLQIFVPPPLISKSAILTVGFGLFLLAYLWPPFILLLAYVASLFVPYAFRKTDEAHTRRVLYAEFMKNPKVPFELKRPPDDIILNEQYWVNSR
jgi:hypothetical protein